MEQARMFDTHLHTKFSTDSQMTVEEVIEKTEELNIGAVITEHIDINYPIEGNFLFDPKIYFNEYSRYRSDKLLLGIELGMGMNCIEENKNLIEKYPFDQVIGSIHLVDGIDIYRKEFYLGKSKKEGYESYFKCMVDCLKTHKFIDTLGHIDYISRYDLYDDNEIYYKDFSEYIDEIIKILVQNDIAMEINTRRFDNAEAVNNIKTIYKRFYELGGRMVTLGSDSHSKEFIGSNLNAAKDIAASCCLKIVHFKNRKPEYQSI